MAARGRLRVYVFLVSGKSGAGKTTLADSLVRMVSQHAAHTSVRERVAFAHYLKMEYSMSTNVPFDDLCTPGTKEQHHPQLVERAAMVLAEDPEFYARMLYDLHVLPAVQDALEYNEPKPLLFVIDDHRYEAERNFLESCELPGVTIVVRTVRVEASEEIRHRRRTWGAQGQILVSHLDELSETSLDHVPEHYWSFPPIINVFDRERLVDNAERVFRSICKVLVIPDARIQETMNNEKQYMWLLEPMPPTTHQSAFLSYTAQDHARMTELADAPAVRAGLTDLMGSPLD